MAQCKYLQMTGDIVASEAVDSHELQYPRRHRLVHSQLLHCLNKSPVKLRRPIHLQPHQPYILRDRGSSLGFRYSIDNFFVNTPLITSKIQQTKEKTATSSKDKISLLISSNRPQASRDTTNLTFQGIYELFKSARNYY